jgi:hypothetical protein
LYQPEGDHGEGATGTYFEICFHGYCPEKTGETVRIKPLAYLCSDHDGTENLSDPGVTAWYSGGADDFIDVTIRDNGTYCGSWIFYPAEKWVTTQCCDLQLAVSYTGSLDQTLNESSHTFSVNQYNASIQPDCHGESIHDDEDEHRKGGGGGGK